MRTINDSLVEMGMKEHPAGSKKLDVDAITEPKLVGMVEERLANMNDITGRKKGLNPAASGVDDDDSTLDNDMDVDDEVNDDDQAVSDGDDNDSTPADEDEEMEDGKEGKKGKDEIEIPEAYIRAAKGNGWSDEDIEEFAKSNPKIALKTFDNLHKTWNKSSQEFAAMGRAARESQQKETQPEKAEKLEYGGVDIESLKKELDLDPAVEQAFKVSNARDAKLTDVLNGLLADKANRRPDATRVDQAARRYDVSAEAAQERHINDFFAESGMESYTKFYGKLAAGETWQDLPRTQAEHRYQVYDVADQMLAGATMTSQSMTLDEALERGHLIVTEGMREEAIRLDIKAKSAKRRKSMVFKPSEGKRTTGGPGGKPKTKNQLLDITEKALVKARNA